MGCAGGKSVTTNDDENKKEQENKKQIDENRKKEEMKNGEEEKKKAEEAKKKAEEEKAKKKAEEEEARKKAEEAKNNENDLTKDDNIEVVSFTEDNMNLEKLRELELNEHNYLRSLHGVPPLTLNTRLNDIAQKYAKIIAQKKVMEHSKPKDRELDGQYVGENLYMKMSSAKLEYICGDMSKSWYSEIKDYNFETGQSTGVTGHFTQLVWKDSREVGFGVAFNEGYFFTVANYFPGGNFNMATTFKEQILPPLPVKEKSCKDLFNLENAKQRELKIINLIRKENGAGDLELDENLSQHALKFAEETANTGFRSTAQEINGEHHSVNDIELNLRRGAEYKGGEGMKKIYINSKKTDADDFTIIMSKALINRKYKKVGFGYYFIDETKLLVYAVFDGY